MGFTQPLTDNYAFATPCAIISYLLLDAKLLLAVVAGVAAARAAVAAVAVEGGGVEPVEPAAPRADAAGHEEEDGHLRQQHLRTAPAQHSHLEHLKQTEGSGGTVRPNEGKGEWKKEREIQSKPLNGSPDNGSI